MNPKQKRLATGIGAAVVLAICLLLLLRNLTHDPAAVVTQWRNAWYYDLNTKTTFIAKQTHLPPVEGPTGPAPDQSPAGVWAYVYTCSTCDEPKNRFIAWIEKLTPQAKSELHALITPMKGGHAELNPFETLNLWDQEGRLIASPEKPTRWFVMDSEEGAALRAESLARCGAGVEPKQCPPVGEEFVPPPQDIPPPEPRPEPVPESTEAAPQ